MAVMSSTDPQSLLVAAIGPACHELRSPLAVVYGFAKMLESQDGLDDTARKYVAQIVTGSQRLDDLLDAMSKVGRIAAGRLHPALESVALKGVVDGISATSRNTGRLSVDAGADVHVKADAEWLGDACQNVIDSLCYEENTELRLSWTHEAHDVSLHFMPHSAFPMVDTEPEKSGLGLSLARMRIVAMGGALDGHVDRVTMTLPRA
jgi:nitrogen-specific signal transduction histidine kinase